MAEQRMSWIINLQNNGLVHLSLIFLKKPLPVSETSGTNIWIVLIKYLKLVSLILPYIAFYNSLCNQSIRLVGPPPYLDLQIVIMLITTTSARHCYMWIVAVLVVFGRPLYYLLVNRMQNLNRKLYTYFVFASSGYYWELSRWNKPSDNHNLIRFLIRWFRVSYFS